MISESSCKPSIPVAQNRGVRKPMPNTLTKSAPLEYGNLAPNFELEAVTGIAGQVVTRHQYRNKSGLVLIFFPLNADAQVWLPSLDQDRVEYEELNSRVLGIGAWTCAQVQAWAAT